MPIGLTIKYENKSIINNVSLPPFKTQIKPDFLFNMEPNKLYTLIMYDPDAPAGDYIHWIITNISNNNKLGNNLLVYKGPSPPKDTGIHRYIFLVYEQKHSINNQKIGAINRITPFNTLLNILQLTNSNLVFKKQFRSSYNGGTKHNRNRKNKRTRKNKRY